MSSFQQVVMGGICLVAAFWFGSYINEQPATPQQPIEKLSNGIIGSATSNQQAQPGLATKTQGFLASIFEPPAKARPVTLSDLKSRSNSELKNVASPSPAMPFVEAPLKMNGPTTEVVSDFVQPPVPRDEADHSFAQHDHGDQQRLEIVPNFSTLAQDVRRAQVATDQKNNQFSQSPASARAGSMLPVPKLDDFSVASVNVPARDWNAVRQEVMSVEDKLKQFRRAHPVAEEFEPVPAFEAPVVSASTSERTGRFVAEDVFTEDFSRPMGIEPQRKLRPAVTANSTQSVPAFSANSSLDLQPAADERFERPRHLQRHRSSEPRPSSRTAPAKTYRPAPAESLAQRQERWRVFGDRLGRQDSASTSNSVVLDRSQAEPTKVEPTDYRLAQSKPAANVRPIPEASRVRSLNEIEWQTEGGFSEGAVSEGAFSKGAVSDRASDEQTVFPQQSQRSEVSQQSSMRRTPQESIVRQTGPEVIRYGDFEAYVTERGDTLQTISQSLYGTPEYYYDLYLANRNVLVNPATVPAGIKLRIPRLGQ